LALRALAAVAEIRPVQLTHLALDVPFVSVDAQEALGQLDRLVDFVSRMA